MSDNDLLAKLVAAAKGAASPEVKVVAAPVTFEQHLSEWEKFKEKLHEIGIRI